MISLTPVSLWRLDASMALLAICPLGCDEVLRLMFSQVDQAKPQTQVVNISSAQKISRASRFSKKGEVVCASILGIGLC